MAEDGFKKFKISIIVEDPEQAEQFLQGLIVAKTNNSSPLFEELIDAVNGGLEAVRGARLEAEMEARRAAGMA